MIKKYEFSRGTLAIVPNEGNTSLVLEDEDRYIVQEKPFQIKFFNIGQRSSP